MALTSEDKTYIKETVSDSIEKLTITINESFQGMHQRFDVLEIQMGNIEKRVGRTEAQLEEIDNRLERKIDLLFDAIAYRSEDSAVKSGH